MSSVHLDPDLWRCSIQAGGELFQVIQAAYKILTDTSCRMSFERRQAREKQHAARHKPTTHKQHHRPQPSHRSYAPPPQSARQHRQQTQQSQGAPRPPDTDRGRYNHENHQHRSKADFDRFYENFRKNANPGGNNENNNPNSRWNGGNNNNNNNNNKRAVPNRNAPDRPRVVETTQDSVTLEWTASPNAVAYHLQWRVKGDDWVAAAQFVKAVSVRKKNLKSGTWYEFRIQAINKVS